MIALFLALALDISDQKWMSAEITPGQRAVSVLVTKTGWRGGSAALLIRDPAEVKRIYGSLAGNRRLSWTCGYHWNFLFEYANGAPQSIDINEDCETFERDNRRTWMILEAAFKRAKTHPTHFVVGVSANDSKSADRLIPKLQPFGFVVREPETRNLLVASPRRWTDDRVKRLRAVCGNVAAVNVMQEFDTGN